MLKTFEKPKFKYDSKLKSYKSYRKNCKCKNIVLHIHDEISQQQVLLFQICGKNNSTK